MQHEWIKSSLESLMKYTGLLLLLFWLCVSPSSAEPFVQASATPAFDVLHYDAQLEPEIAGKSLRGRVLIRLVSRVNNLASIELDCGDLVIDAVRENRVGQKFASSDHRLKVSLSRPARANETRAIEVEYHGTPRRGIRFFPEQEQVYTVFSTSYWMV